MLYILSGTSRSGKTLVAKEFLKQTGIPYMSVDAIMMGFTNGIPEYGIHDRLWPDEIAERMWPFYKAMCVNVLWSQTDYVLEGEAFLPHLVQELIESNPENVRVAFMGYSEVNLAQKVQDLKTYSSGIGDWLIDKPEDYIKSHIKNMIEYSAMIKTKCTQHEIPYFDTSHDFDGTIHRVLSYLDY